MHELFYKYALYLEKEERMIEIRCHLTGDLKHLNLFMGRSEIKKQGISHEEFIK